MWRGGVWRSGTWLGGTWHAGEWHGGTWQGGEWNRGEWHGGTWHGGAWHAGTWQSGVWHGGEWQGGVWRGGEWRGGENRLLYMASLAGIHFDEEGFATAYRTTSAGGVGRYSRSFRQPSGEWYDPYAEPAGSGICRPGIHVTSAARAWTYFGIDPACEFWRVRFRREDLLDCDGEKARIRGGVFEKIDRPF